MSYPRSEPTRAVPRSLRLVAALAILVAVVATACNELPADPIEVDNTSDQKVVIWGVWGDGSADPPFGGIAAGTITTLTDDECIEPDLEARLDDGTVVAELPKPFCQGDPTWVITQDQVDAATAG